MKKSFLLLLLLLLVGSLSVPTAYAGNHGFGISWSSTVGTGNTADFISGLQLRGMNLEYRQKINRDRTWGINVGYNVFSNTGDDTVYLENAQATGKWGQYINTVPIYACYYFELGEYQRRAGRMYVGMNGGTAWLEQRTTLGLYAKQDRNWHVAFAPEIGYHMPWSSFLGHVSVRYNYVLKAGEVDAQSWFEFRIGFGLD